jgi:hypothetical protein
VHVGIARRRAPLASPGHGAPSDLSGGILDIRRGIDQPSRASSAASAHNNRIHSLSVRPPHGFFRPTETSKLRCPQWRFCN